MRGEGIGGAPVTAVGGDSGESLTLAPVLIHRGGELGDVLARRPELAGQAQRSERFVTLRDCASQSSDQPLPLHPLEPVTRQLLQQDARVALGELAAEQQVNELEAGRGPSSA